MNQRAPTLDEVRFLRAQLEHFGVKGREAEAEVRSAEVTKHELLLEAGGDPDQSGIVVSGVVREYYLQPDGTEHTRGFALAGDSFGSLSDALLRRPARVFVRAETNARVLLLRWSAIERLAKKSLEWERLQAKLLERLYLRKSVREFELLALDAMGRYQSLLGQHPGLEQLVPAPLIASYVGITNVHLSRLRRRRGTSRQRSRPARKRVSEA
ncbi:MAG: cyclic nucleotide-binding domain-containing protein [Archangium sp.]|nr:cyclic nucleotide-binding domain-containing protein [Archangium sp.]